MSDEKVARVRYLYNVQKLHRKVIAIRTGLSKYQIDKALEDKSDASARKSEAA